MARDQQKRSESKRLEEESSIQGTNQELMFHTSLKGKFYNARNIFVSLKEERT